MSKTLGISLSILAIILLILYQCPVSLAEPFGYGLVHGRAIDRNGNTIPGVSVMLVDGESRFMGSTMTDARGEYAFDRVPLNSSQETFKIRASLDKNGSHWSGETAFFYVSAVLMSTQDVRFYDYPPSGVGGLYGIVTSDNNYFVEVPATVYLDNGMFLLYPGNRYDQWTFDQLPQGQYVLWAERNVNNVTYASQRYVVTVPSDEKAYQSIYLTTKDPVAYHQQPVPIKNVIHGTVTQKNGAILPDAKIDLYRLSGSSLELVASTSSNINGQYLFDNVNINTPTAQFKARATFDANGGRQTQDSDTFTVYIANTINVTHDYNVPISVPYATTGSVTIGSTPSGARINIDGTDSGHATPYDLSLKSGSHTLVLSMDGYFSDTTILQVQPDRAMAINRTLKLSTGNLSIEVNPSGAQIYFDGKLLGSGPQKVSKKPAGDYSYLLVCDGYQNESGTVSILPGESVTRKFNMVATPGISPNYIVYLIGSVLESIGHIL
jgi:5-hydroxyisourate hydrolase-like protein (transthyretin family)